MVGSCRIGLVRAHVNRRGLPVLCCQTATWTLMLRACKGKSYVQTNPAIPSRLLSKSFVSRVGELGHWTAHFQISSRIIIRKRTLSICTLMFVLSAASLAESGTASNGALRDTSRKVLSAFIRGESRGIREVVSEAGLEVVERFFDWDHGHVWRERKDHFSGFAVAGGRFRRHVLKPYQRHVSKCWQAPGWAPHRFLNVRDHWGHRKPGPVIEGKLASNYFFYLHMRLEKNILRLWRTETAIH